jgi:hypothetical protein
VVLPQFSSEGVIHGWAYFSIAAIGHLLDARLGTRSIHA